MSDIFTEVDEAMKQERLENLWKQYGKLVIFGLSGIVLGTAANAGYTSWQTKQNTQSTDLFLKTTQSATHTSDDLLNIAPQLQKNIRGLALISAAQKELEKGNANKAVEIYKQIKTDKNYEQSIMNVADYMIASYDESLDDVQKLAQFVAIAQDENNAYQYRAYLDAALIEAEINNNYTTARTYLDLIAQADGIPKSLKSKAQSIDIIYAIKETAQNQN